MIDLMGMRKFIWAAVICAFLDSQDMIQKKEPQYKGKISTETSITNIEIFCSLEVEIIMLCNRNKEIKPNKSICNL